MNDDEILNELKALRVEIHRARETVKKTRLHDFDGPPRAIAAAPVSPVARTTNPQQPLPGAAAAQETGNA